MLEIGIERQQAGVGKSLGQLNQAGVGQRHRRVRITTHQRVDAGGIVPKVDANLEAALCKLSYQVRGPAPGTMDQEARFGQYRLAGHQGRRERRQLIHDPAMPTIAPIEMVRQ